MRQAPSRQAVKIRRSSDISIQWWANSISVQTSSDLQETNTHIIKVAEAVRDHLTLRTALPSVIAQANAFAILISVSLKWFP